MKARVIERSKLTGSWNREGIRMRRRESGDKDGADGEMPHEEQQDLNPVVLRRDPMCTFWELVIPSRTVSDVDSWICIVLASRSS